MKWGGRGAEKDGMIPRDDLLLSIPRSLLTHSSFKQTSHPACTYIFIGWVDLSRVGNLGGEVRER